MDLFNHTFNILLKYSYQSYKNHDQIMNENTLNIETLSIDDIEKPIYKKSMCSYDLTDMTKILIMLFDQWFEPKVFEKKYVVFIDKKTGQTVNDDYIYCFLIDNFIHSLKQTMNKSINSYKNICDGSKYEINRLDKIPQNNPSRHSTSAIIIYELQRKYIIHVFLRKIYQDNHSISKVFPFFDESDDKAMEQESNYDINGLELNKFDLINATRYDGYRRYIKQSKSKIDLYQEKIKMFGKKSGVVSSFIHKLQTMLETDHLKLINNIKIFTMYQAGIS